MIPSVIIGKSPIGKGVFASVAFRPGQEILEFKGGIYHRGDLPRSYRKESFLQIGFDLYMGPSNDIDDFVNHSCDPNSAVYWAPGGRLVLRALKTIEPLKEITWDYSTWMLGDEWDLKCDCASEACRGTIRDFKHLPEELRKKYTALGIVGVFALEV